MILSFTTIVIILVVLFSVITLSIYLFYKSSQKPDIAKSRSSSNTPDICGTQYVNLQTDSKHCGTCGNSCGKYECYDGECLIPS